MKRHELRKLANKKHRDPFDTTIHEQYHVTLTQYKKLLNSTMILTKPRFPSLIQMRNFSGNPSNRLMTLKKGEDVPSISGKKLAAIFAQSSFK